MKKPAIVLASVLLLVASLAADTDRKVVKMQQPSYPTLARQMQLSGTVRLEAVVLPSGKIKDVKVLGGHPLLSGAAVEAAKRWQYEPAPVETTEVISVKFVPAQ